VKKRKTGAMDGYIAGFPQGVRRALNELRAAIRAAAPAAEETFSYGIPTFDLNGHLVHFAAYGNHIGFYPASSGIRAFKKELAAYKTSAGTVQFPLDRPLPLALIAKIVKFRVAENIKGYRDKLKGKKK